MDEENQENEELEIEKEVKNIFVRKNLWVIVGLILLLCLIWYVRTINVPNLKDITTGNYTLGPDLDPFLFLRYDKYIIQHGSLMEHDPLRYVPLEFDTAGETILLPYMMAYFYKFLSLFSNVSIEYSALIFPVAIFVFTAIVFFLFIRKIFEKNKYKNIIALLSTAFLAFAPSLLSRTVAGIPEKESVGFLFMFLAFYVFLLAWKSQKSEISDDYQNSERILKSEGKKSYIFALVAAISTTLMGLVWGGVIYVFMVIAITVLVAFVFEKVGKKEFYIYSLWILLPIILIPLLSGRFSITGMLVSTSSGLAFAVFFIMMVDLVVFKTKFKDSGIIRKMQKKIPDRIISIIVAGLILVVAASLFFGISFIPGFFGDVINQLVNPFVDRHSLTVAENKQPYFGEWQSSFGPEIKGIPLLFWLFFIGSIFLFYKTFKSINKKDRIVLTLFYTLFLFSIIFSRYSQTSIMNGENAISKIVFLGGVFIFFIVFAYIYYKDYKKDGLMNFKEINLLYLFLIIYFIIGLIGARSAIRLVMALVPSAVAIVGFFIVEVFEIATRQKDKNFKFIAFVVAAIVIIFGAYALYINYEITKGGAANMIPSTYTHQWQTAMSWVRENTPTNAVFAHWWDYGYWVQSLGNRATVLDGGNAIGYWNYLLARHVLTGTSELDALEFMYAHNSTYLLIDSTDIGKYGAYSSIGGDENYDRYSWIGSFFINNQATQETQNTTYYFYQGGIALDEDYLFTGEQEIFFPARKAGVGALVFGIGTSGDVKQPEAIFVYQGQQVKIPLRYAYFKNKLYDFGSGYEGAAYIMTQVDTQTGGAQINDLGAALFLSERNMRALWVRMYLIGENKDFKLVYTEPDPVIASLKSQGANLGDFIYFNGIRGPIKIWEAEFPSNIQFKEEYLSIDYPKSLMEVKTF